VWHFNLHLVRPDFERPNILSQTSNVLVSYTKQLPQLCTTSGVVSWRSR
jgi:hypothetical protein